MTESNRDMAKDVRIGDQVFNNGAYHPSAAWCTVWKIEIDGKWVKLFTGLDHDHPLVFHYHERECVAFKRGAGA